jgi:hypothetical protein
MHMKPHRVVPTRTLLTAYGLEFVAFSLYALVIHRTQPWYQKHHLTIVTVMLGIIGAGSVPMTLVRRYPTMSAQEYEDITVGAFWVSFVPMAMQQALRSAINGTRRDKLNRG